MIRLTVPSIDESDLEAVSAVLRTGQLVQGGRVAEFEQAIAKQVGVPHAVAVTNCTAALRVVLEAIGITAGDKVAVTTYSWPATANVIALCGAEPVFVDIDERDFNMSPDRLADVLEREPVDAILPVHAFGAMADIPALLELAAAHGVPVIEDAACALGATLDGRPAGAWGLAGCFSFHPRKAITTGEGGMITTSDEKLADKLRAFRNHGLDPQARAPDFIVAGDNLRLTEFQAALGTSQMKRFWRLLDNRRSAAAVYDRLLSSQHVVAPSARAKSEHAYQSYVALLPRECAARRADIIARLRDAGIETTIGTYHMPLTSYWRSRQGHAVGDFPVTDDVFGRAISLPLFEGITAAQQEEVVQTLIEHL